MVVAELLAKPGEERKVQLTPGFVALAAERAAAQWSLLAAHDHSKLLAMAQHAANEKNAKIPEDIQSLHGQHAKLLLEVEEEHHNISP